jgi:anti-sigma regulatory factor (Ser/Thr protein kinase)
VSTVELTIPPLSHYLALVRLVVANAALSEGSLSNDQMDDLALAVSEACANAVDSERAHGSSQPIRIVVELGEHGVAVTVTDHGGGFVAPAPTAPMPAVGDPQHLRHERGLGIPLMRRLADDVSFRATAEGTAVRLVVGIAPST